MSYLQFPRLAFTGKFQADVSTVNNDPRHFDNEYFSESFQKFSGEKAMNGWWNPTGTAIMRFTDCTIKSLRDPSGQLLTEAGSDPLIGCRVGNSLDRPAGKLVDLDTDWQLASNIYGLSVSLLAPDGLPIMTAEYESNPFRDLWFTRSTDGGDSGASAMFQSVLTDIVWHRDDWRSPFLDALRAASERDLLSIRLTTYGYQQAVKQADGQLTPDFGYGIVLGNIGPAKADQPRSFILGRRFIPNTNAITNAQSSSNGNPNDTANGNGISCFSTYIDADTKTLQVDLSNALPLGPGYQILNNGPLKYAALHDESFLQNAELGADDYTLLGEVDLSQQLQNIEGGVQAVTLTSDMLAATRGKPLALIQVIDDKGSANVCIREVVQGLEVRPETFTFKLDPNEPSHNRADTVLYAARYGEPYADQELEFRTEPPAPDYSNSPASQKPGATPRATIPVNNVPGLAVRIKPERPRTDSRGRAVVTISGPEIMGNPRGYIDGQLYAITYNFAGSNTAMQQTFDQIAAVVYSTFPAPGQSIDIDNPTWDDVQPILQQYANLYPVMSKGLFDFSKQPVADSAAFIMHFVFAKPVEDPDQMPVTRDLSSSKRRMLINYFANVMQRTGKTMDRQVLFGKRCPLHGLAGNREEAADLTAVAMTKVGKAR
ncbi:hypothetical protein [Trinickia dinghuensis]|uniref:Uncharacterized protein n=1 Tax=Trinickia dinghuensis TaxID=2291023 RepID=A0A3D8JYQ5_9BURK|nr:hypothetical protein [Trinickia dinghuensis]RDU98010.1 hypothetical protein DWV00_15915 [Trinickia dinghuensis]